MCLCFLDGQNIQRKSLASFLPICIRKLGTELGPRGWGLERRMSSASMTPYKLKLLSIVQMSLGTQSRIFQFMCSNVGPSIFFVSILKHTCYLKYKLIVFFWYHFIKIEHLYAKNHRLWVFFLLQLSVQWKSMYSFIKFKIFHLMWPQDKREALIRLEHIKAEVLREKIQWCCMGNIDILASSLIIVKNL